MNFGSVTNLYVTPAIFGIDKRITSVSYWMVLGRQRRIQLSHLYLNPFLSTVKFGLKSWKDVNRQLLIKFRQN